LINEYKTTPRGALEQQHPTRWKVHKELPAHIVEYVNIEDQNNIIL
jgi:hypothetical protein